MEICARFVLHVKSLTLWVEGKSFNYLEQCTACCFPLNSCIFNVLYVTQLESNVYCPFTKRVICLHRVHQTNSLHGLYQPNDEIWSLSQCEMKVNSLCKAPHLTDKCFKYCACSRRRKADVPNSSHVHKKQIFSKPRTYAAGVTC